MDSYDPLHAPDADQWLELDESERIALVTDHHRRAGVKLPNLALHATIHVIVETQAAMRDELPVRRTLDRLQVEGLDRHEAVHAIGSVLAEHMHEVMRAGVPSVDPNHAYWKALETLTARSGDDTRRR
jgi:hypothetical protein